MAPDLNNIKTKVNNRFKDISDVIKTKSQGLKGKGDGEGGLSKVTSTVSSSVQKITGKISKKKTGSMPAPSESRLRRIANKLFHRKKSVTNDALPAAQVPRGPSFGVKDTEETVSSVHDLNESVQSLPDFLDNTHNPDEETSVTYKSVIQE